MRVLELGQGRIAYDLLGQEGRPAVAITPGGRFSMDAPGVRELGEALASLGWRVLLWDRPNCGASDVCFSGESESAMQGEALVGLIRALDLGPTVLAGGSAGVRVCLAAALADPRAVSRMVLWWISGGIVSLTMLGASYCGEPAVAASMGGMAAVAAMPAFAEQVARNPRNRDIILAQDPAVFVQTMERWAAGFVPAADTPLPGYGPEYFARLTMPVTIVRGSPSDIFHPAHICEQVHDRLPRSQLVDSPWPDDLFARRMAEGKGVFLDWPDLAPIILAAGPT